MSQALVPSSLGLAAIQTLLDHDPTLLNIREIGRLSTCSHKLAAAVDATSVWKKVFERASNAGRKYDFLRSNGRNNHKYQFWSGEKGLLGCFSDPSEAVIEKIGYKRAAACLLTKSCARCGRIAGNANPLTMERLCCPCFKDDEASFMIAKSKAKEAFLLSEKDVKQLETKAQFPDRNFAGKDCTSTVLLMSEVKSAAFEKYGGADGLAEEIGKRKRAAEERFQKSQKTAKPQKKRSKIERLSDRPAENPTRNEYTLGHGLPIGTFYDLGRTKMEPSSLCNKCPVSGAVEDICMHEKLEHGFVTNFLGTTENPPTQCPEFKGLTSLGKMPGATKELVELFSGASVEFIRVDDEYEKRKVCLLSFGDSGVKVSVDYIRVQDYFTDLSDGNVQVCFQTVSGQLPLKLLNLAWKWLGTFHHTKDEVALQHIEALARALGQPLGDPVHFMALFVSRVLTHEEADDILSEMEQRASDDEYRFPENPFFRGVWDTLTADH